MSRLVVFCLSEPHLLLQNGKKQSTAQTPRQSSLPLLSTRTPSEPSYSEGRNSKHWAQGFHAAVSWMGLKTVRSNSFSCVLVEKSTLWHFSKGIYHHSVMVNTSQELFCTLIYFVARVFKLLSNSDLQPKLPVKTNVNLSLRWKRSYSCITLQSVEITACHAINFSLCYCCSLMCNSGS